MNSEKWSKGSELRALLKTSSCRGKGRLLSSAAATEVLLTSDAFYSRLNFASAPLAFQILKSMVWLSSKPNSKGSHNNQACNFLWLVVATTRHSKSSLQRVSILAIGQLHWRVDKEGKKRHSSKQKSRLWMLSKGVINPQSDSFITPE